MHKFEPLLYLQKKSWRKDYSMNQTSKEPITQILPDARYEKGHVTAIDVLVKLGYLKTQDVEDWRFGRIPYLKKIAM